MKTRPFFFVKITLGGGHVVSKAAKRFHAARHHVFREYAGNFMGPPFARSWTTLTSFGLRAALLGTLLVLSLLKAVEMPRVQIVSTPISLGRPDPAPKGTRSPGRTGSAAQIIPLNGRILASTQVPTSIPRGGDDSAPQAPGIGGGPGNIGLQYGSENGLNLPIEWPNKEPRD